jgi:excinuclease UvrABC ATPase subunit
VVVTGSPEEVAACKASHTGSFLKERLKGSRSRVGAG